MGWVGFDLDGTLAHYDGWQGLTIIGPPIAAMVERVKDYRRRGIEVRIFTARVARADREERMVALCAIDDWSHEVFGEILPVTCIKDQSMIRLYDDRAVGVETNTGRLLNGDTSGGTNGQD